MSKFIPNSFQVPNALVDELIADMKEAELKCFLLVIRKTAGWNKETDAISISQFMEALKLSRDAVISGCKRLVEKGLLIKLCGFRGVSVYSLDWSKIQTSQKSRLVRNSDATSLDFRQDLVRNSDTQTNTLQKTLKQNTTPLTPQGEAAPPEPKKSQPSGEKLDPENMALPEYVNHESWVAYCRMRKAKRAEIKTERTLELCLRDLAKHSGGDPKLATAILEQSIANTWTGLFALKNDTGKPSGAASTKPSAHHGFANKDYTPSAKWDEPEWAKESNNATQ